MGSGAFAAGDSIPRGIQKPRVALVCDWLVMVGGAERVLLELHKLYPEAPIYTSKYSKKGIDWFDDADVRTGWLQIFPNCLRRFISPLRMRYFSKLDLTDYDLVISVTGAEAKAVKTREERTRKQNHEKINSKKPEHQTLHICYCHVPTQYYWGLYDQYLENPGFGILNPLARLGLKLFLKPMRKKDYAAAQHPDYFVTISDYAASEIKKYYKRESEVIYPPVDTKTFSGAGDQANKKSTTTTVSVENSKIEKGKCQVEKDHIENNKNEKSQNINKHENAESQIDQGSNNTKLPNQPAFEQYSCSIEIDKSQIYYIATSRQVSWKRLDLAVKACKKSKKPLILIGEGPEHNKLIKLAGNLAAELDPNSKTFSEDLNDSLRQEKIIFLPKTSQSGLKVYLENALAYLFPSQEPFGIAPVEALAAGCPVIAYKKGGATDYIKDGENGVLFDRQSVDSLSSAIESFEKLKQKSPAKFKPEKLTASALPFDTEVFVNHIKEFVDEKLK